MEAGKERVGKSSTVKLCVCFFTKFQVQQDMGHTPVTPVFGKWRQVGQHYPNLSKV